MTPQNIEAELSYAYLHAVAARAGIACDAARRAHDNLGIDAMLSVVDDFGPKAVMTEVTLHIQLKATSKKTALKSGRRSYFLKEVDEYERLRANTVYPTRFLAVLFLPEDADDWLKVTDEQLIAKRAAYWVSLVGAPPSRNKTGQTVYLPESQLLCPDELRRLFKRVAHQEKLLYAV